MPKCTVLSRHPNPDISGWCSGFVYCREFSYKLTGFDSGPYALECWLNGSRWESKVWSGPEYPERGCRVKGNILLVPHVVVDGIKSNELRWPAQSDDEETQTDGREVRIEWGKDLSSDPDPDISGWCSGFVYCREFSYKLTGFDSSPYVLECWLNGRRWESKVWSGPEERGCRAKGNILLIPHVVVDGVESNKLSWARSDDEETQPGGREVRIEWGEDLSRHPDPNISGDCRGFVFCKAFNYELSGFGPGPHTYECWINNRRWPSYPVSGREGCRARGRHLLEVFVVVDGVPSTKLRWTAPG